MVVYSFCTKYSLYKSQLMPSITYKYSRQLAFLCAQIVFLPFLSYNLSINFYWSHNMPSQKLLTLINHFKNKDPLANYKDGKLKSWELLLVDNKQSDEYTASSPNGIDFVVIIDPTGITQPDIFNLNEEITLSLRKIKGQFYTFKLMTRSDFRDYLLTTERLSETLADEIIRKAKPLASLVDALGEPTKKNSSALITAQSPVFNNSSNHEQNLILFSKPKLLEEIDKLEPAKRKQALQGLIEELSTKLNKLEADKLTSSRPTTGIS